MLLLSARHRVTRRSTASGALGVLFCVATAAVSPLWAAVADVTPADVTTRAFSVVWASDEPVTAATLHVYADAGGLTEITGGLGLYLASQDVAESHPLGIVKVDVTGLAADTCYYVQSETTGASGTVLSPAAAPFTEVCTQIASERATPGDAPIVNDLIRHDVLQPDRVSAATGAALLLSAPGLGTHPVSVLVGDEFAAPAGVVDLNNLFDAVTRTSAEVPAGQILQLTELRGLLCADPTEHRSVRFRRAPAHAEVPTVGFPITEIEAGVACFFADTYCDDTIDILDAQRVLTAFGGQSGDCRFNPDLDIVADQSIDILDVQSVLNRFGESAPFTP